MSVKCAARLETGDVIRWPSRSYYGGPRYGTIARIARAWDTSYGYRRFRVEWVAAERWHSALEELHESTIAELCEAPDNWPIVERPAPRPRDARGRFVALAA